MVSYCIILTRDTCIAELRDEASAILLLVCLHEVWVKVTYDWSTRTCAYGRPYVDPAFTSQSYDIIISISTRRTNLSIFLVLMLMVMHGLVKTRLKEAS